ncbi:MAG: twin-arginine translocase subunit TatC [Gammaproteobacteria bacterium]|nr:twin-arginine translocase subunit TatC [Gammaproteobacteria bacterium]
MTDGPKPPDAEPANNPTPAPSAHDSDAEAHAALVDSAEMPFMAHLIELRQRILKGLFAVVALFLPIYFFANDLYVLVAAPLMAHLPGDGTMIATEVASPFLTPFKLAIYAAIFVGMPVILHQAWSFVAPGLYKHEKRFAMPLLLSSIGLFYLGMAFAYFAVFPLVFQFMAAVTPIGVTMMTDINRYLDFVLTMFLAFGFAFEIPIATLLLVWSGISTAQGIANKRPYVIVGCFAAGMLLTPPDVISQLLLALPTWVLFEIGILFARVAEKRNEVA